MASVALGDGAAAAPRRVLVGGLGMGFTLRAVLDRLGPRAQVDVLELLADVVDWNRGPLGGYADHPLDDPRVRLYVVDLLDHLTSEHPAYDAILLDIDNGPEAFTVSANARLYALAGLAVVHDALAPQGVMVLWSAFRSTQFEQRLRKAGFAARSVTVRARGPLGKGTRHTLFVATRPSAAWS